MSENDGVPAELAVRQNGDDAGYGDLPKAVVEEIERDLAKLGINLDDPTARLVIQQVRALTLYQGSFPPPEVLEAYNKVVPGLGNHLISSWQEEKEHRRTLEKSLVQGWERRSDRAQHHALAVALVGLVGATVVGIWGHWLAATVIGIVSVGGPAAATILARYFDFKSDSDQSKPT